MQDFEGAIANEADAATAQYWADVVHNVTEVGYGKRGQVQHQTTPPHAQS